MSDYNNLTEPGTYKARLKSWGLKETEAGAIQFTVLFEVLAQWIDKAWQDWPEPPFPTCFGNFTLVKKDGALLEAQLKSVQQSLQWFGTFRELEETDWSSTEVRIVCKESDYNGETTIRAEWMNPVEGSGGALLGNVDGDRLKALDAKYGRDLKAFNGAAAKARPVAKPAPTREDALVAAGMPSNAKDDIPF